MAPSESNEPQRARRLRPRSGVVLCLAYVLGPFAPVVLRQGKHNLPWVLLPSLALLVWGGMIWRWAEVRHAVTTGTIALVPWMLGIAAASSVWVLAMARALWLAGRDARFVPHRLPAWVCRPRVCMLLGFALPGFGHLVSDHPRRAAIAGAIATSTLLPWLVLWQAEWIWQCNRNAGSAAIPGLALEVVFLVAAALAGGGSLAWIGASLDGARLQTLRLNQHAGLHGDRVALALLITWILTLLNLHPEQLAKDVDQFAAPLQSQGYRLVPLCLEWTAMRLDRAEPRYAMVHADLLDAMGKHTAAQAMRRDLHRRWESYAEHLLREEVRIGGVLYPPLISVNEESLPRWPWTPEVTVPLRADSVRTTTTAADSTTASQATAADTTAKSVAPAADGAASDAPAAAPAGTPPSNVPAAAPAPSAPSSAPTAAPAPKVSSGDSARATTSPREPAAARDTL